MAPPGKPLRPRCVAALLASAAAVATLAACGGEDSGEDFAADAEAICTESTREQAEIGLAAGPTGDFAAAAEQMAALRQSGARALDELEALNPPEDSAETWSEYLDNRRRAVALVADRQLAAKREDAETMTAAAVGIEELLKERDDLGEQMGLTACARILPAADEQRVRETVELASVSGDGARVCEEAIASVYLEQQFGGSVERCGRAQREARRAGAVDFRDVYGVAGVLATAEVELSGGALDGRSATLQLVFEDDGYRIFSVTTASRSA